MKKFGLIGYPLEHSFSPTYFAEKFFKEGLKDCAYHSYPIDSLELLPKLLRENPDLHGLNVTIPYKETIIKYLDELDATAERIGSVNCIAIQDHKLKGFNTDYIGFLKSIQPLFRAHHRRALVLGSGGSSKMVCYALKKLGITPTIVSRKDTPTGLTYESLSEKTILSNTVIVNTTPVGLYPEVAASPKIPYEFLGSQHLMYDLIYNPELTVFLLKGRQQGAVTKNGMEMLQIQAEESWEIWNSSWKADT